ncbi:MAG: PIN domain-containing protein [Halobaculum sp.]
MVFLDSSAIIEYQIGNERVQEYLTGREPWWTSPLCVYEVVAGRLGGSGTDVQAVRNEFGGVRVVDLNETIALEAARLQDELLADGNRLATADALIAATARSTGDELVVADDDFQTSVLADLMAVRNFEPASE